MAWTGSEALSKMAEMFFDCVLSDAHTPGMSRVDICRAVKARCPGTRVLLVTAYSDMLSLWDRLASCEPVAVGA